MDDKVKVKINYRGHNGVESFTIDISKEDYRKLNEENVNWIVNNYTIKSFRYAEVVDWERI